MVKSFEVMDRAFSRWEERVAKVLFVFFIIAYFIRLFYGVSVVDEMLYVSISHLPDIGGKWFVNDLTIQTTSAIFFSSLIRLYIKIFGTDGVLVFSRSLYLLAALGVSRIIFLLAQKFLTKGSALILSLIPVIFIGYGISSLYYNGSGSLLFGAATALGVLSLMDNSPKKAFWSGICWATCCFVYPSYALLFCVWLILFYWQSRNTLNIFKKFFLGALIAGSLWFIVLTIAGWDHIIESIRFSSKLNQPGALWKIKATLEAIKSYNRPAHRIIFAFLLWLYLLKKKPAFASLGAMAFTFGYFIKAPHYIVSALQIYWIYFLILSSTLILYFWKRWALQEKRMIFLIIFPAILGSLLTLFTSLQMLSNTYITGIFGALAVYMLGENTIYKKWAIWGVVLIIIINTNWYLRTAYEDDYIRNMTYVIKSGPYKWIHTHPAKGELITQVQEDLKQLPAQGTILFKDQFPAGYLMTEHAPAGPTINLLSFMDYPQARPVYKAIFDKPENKPDIVVEFFRFPDYSTWSQIYMGPGRDFSKDEFNDYFMKTGEYKVSVQRESYRILLRSH